MDSAEIGERFLKHCFQTFPAKYSNANRSTETADSIVEIATAEDVTTVAELGLKFHKFEKLFGCLSCALNRLFSSGDKPNPKRFPRLAIEDEPFWDFCSRRLLSACENETLVRAKATRITNETTTLTFMDKLSINFLSTAQNNSAKTVR